MEKRINYILIIVTAIALAFLPFVIKVVYQTNDDNIYMYMLSGVFNGECSPITIYEGYLQGLFVSSLYKMYNGIEWYSLFLITMSLLSYIIIAWIVLNSNINRLIKYALFITLFSIQLYFHISPQFTVIASELSIASFLVYLFGTKRRETILSLFLFIFAFEMRYDAAVLSFVLLTPLLFVKSRINKSNFKTRFVEISIFLFVAIALKGIDIWSLSSNNEFSAYYQYNKPRNYLGCNPGYSFGKDLLDEGQAQELDQMYDIWVFDSNILTRDVLEKCASEVKQHWKAVVVMNVADYFDMYFRVGLFFLLIVFIPLLWMYFKRKEWISIVSFLLLLLLFLVVNLYMMSYSFPKTRNIIPVFLAFLVYGIICACCYKNRILNVLLAFVLLICTGLYTHKANYVRAWNFDHLSKVDEVSKIINQVPDDKVLFSSLVPFQTEIYKSTNSEIAKKIVLSDWITNSPYSLPYYKGYQSLIEGLPFLINKEEIKHIDNIIKQIDSYYHISTVRDIVTESDNFYIVRLRQL